MSQGEALAKRAIASTQHFTEPPPRFSEASLVKRMEELGIGRPSTYASILQVLKDRSYVRLDKRRLYAEDKGRLVIAFLESFFARYVEYDFTAALEEQLDRVSNNEIDWKQVLRDFWRDFTGAIDETKELRITDVLNALDEMLGPARLPGEGRRQRSRASARPAAPAASTSSSAASAPLSAARTIRNAATRARSRRATKAATAARAFSAIDPATGLEVSLRAGRFGPYLQLGEAAEGEKPKRSSIPKGTEPGRSRSRASASRCCRCRAKSASIRKTASRSWPASAASGLMCSTARPTRISTRARTCSPSGSIARSR